MCAKNVQAGQQEVVSERDIRRDAVSLKYLCLGQLFNYHRVFFKSFTTSLEGETDFSCRCVKMASGKV